MIESVHIPIYCDNEAAKYGALLTLKTVRVGFPKAHVFIHWYGILNSVFEEMKAFCVGEKFNCITYSHKGVPNGDHRNDYLIKQLVEGKQVWPSGFTLDCFAVIDSDVVFFENCEDFEPVSEIAGEYIPEFVCPIAKAVTASRLHTAFFVVRDPASLRRQIELCYRPAMPKFCPFDPFAPVVTFKDQVPHFHDSCGVLYHAIGGEHFGPNMLKRFEHLYGGSYCKEGPHFERIKSAYENPESARGFRDTMTQFFNERKP